jgi:hypothetical protein
MRHDITLLTESGEYDANALHAQLAQLRRENELLMRAQQQIANAAGIKLAAARMVLMRYQNEPGVRGVLDTFARLEEALATAETTRLELRGPLRIARG